MSEIRTPSRTPDRAVSSSRRRRALRSGSVGNNKIDRVLAPKDFQRFFARIGLKNGVAEVFEHCDRIHQDEGVVIRAHNFGGPGMVSFQETALFTQLVLAGERPDLVVFFDGINDYVVQGGLQPGEQLIVSGLQKIRDGAPVMPAPPAGAAPEPKGK